MKTLLLSKYDVQASVTMDEVIAAVENAYRAFQNGSVAQPPIQTMGMPEYNAESDVKSCYNRDNSCFSIKTVGLFHDNIKPHFIFPIRASFQSCKCTSSDPRARPCRS